MLLLLHVVPYPSSRRCELSEMDARVSRPYQSPYCTDPWGNSKEVMIDWIIIHESDLQVPDSAICWNTATNPMMQYEP